MKKRTPGLEGCARCLKFVMMFGNCIFAVCTQIRGARALSVARRPIG